MFLPTFYTDREKGPAMRREWELEDLIECWTLDEDEFALVGNKTGATRLGFGLLLKFFEQEGRFPRHVGELPKAVVDYVAGQVKVDPGSLAEYDWSGRSVERHRAQVRQALGFRESTRADEDVLAEWLKEHQEVSMLCLHLLQSALVFINTLLIQSVLKDPAWQQKMTDADKRGLSPLFWSNANLYGTTDRVSPGWAAAAILPNAWRSRAGILEVVAGSSNSSTPSAGRNPSATPSVRISRPASVRMCRCRSRDWVAVDERE